MMSEAATIEDLLKACQAAASQEHLTAALDTLAAAIPDTQEAKSDEIALFLIRHVVIIGTAPNPTTVSLDKSLNACGPQATLGACSQIFSEAARIKIESPCPLETSFRTTRRLLLTMPESADDILWLQHLNTISIPTETYNRHDDITMKATLESIVSLALLIPAQIANACHFQKLVLPAWCVRSRYLPRLVECALSMDYTIKTLEASMYVRVLIQKIVHSGGNDEAAMALYQYYHHSTPDPTWFQSTVLAIMRSLVTKRDCATLLRSILRHLITKVQRPENESLDDYCRKELLPYLKLVCRPILESSTNVREAFVQLTILSSTSCASRADAKMDRVFCHCVALLLAACDTTDNDSSSSSSGEEEDGLCSGEPSTVLERHLYEVASCWSEAVFVQRMDIALQQHVTNFILSAISLLERKDINHVLVGTILTGVTARLKSSIFEVRRNGMHVGEVLAQHMGQELKFEEIDNERAPTNDESTVRERAVPSEVPPPRNTNKKKSRRNRAPKLIDPDAEYISDEGSSDSSVSYEDTRHSDDEDSVWDESDELIPYNLNDDEEDLRETAVPLYLRECLDMLRTLDSDEAFIRQETGLSALSSLVRSNPLDLPDLTVPLCKSVLALENKTDLPDFNAKFASSLLSLTVMQPILAGEHLITEFFEGDRGLFIRLLILSTLEEGAIELCGAKALKEEREKQNSERKVPAQRVSGKRRLVPESSTSSEIQDSVDHAVLSMESRTRRWGRGSRHTKPMSVVNAFGPVAPVWFYSLVSGFMKHKGNTSLWSSSNGARLLSSFLVALGTIVECSGIFPGTEVLARDLCELAWSFRNVDVPEVRASLLVAIASSLGVLRDDALMGVLYCLHDLPEFLRGVALEDSNETCRQIASAISSNVSQVIGSMMDSRSITS